MKLITVIVFVFISNTALPCMFSNSGPEFDALIEIAKLEDKNTFSITLPRQLNNSWVRSVGIAFRKKGPVYYEGEEEPRLEYLTEYVEPLYSHNLFDYLRIINRSKVKLIYKAQPKDGHIQSIVAHWPTEVCSTYAISEKLDIE